MPCQSVCVYELIISDMGAALDFAARSSTFGSAADARPVNCLG